MAFIPFSDDNPTQRWPLVTCALIAACVLVFLWQVGLNEKLFEGAVYAYGFIPSRLLSGSDFEPTAAAFIRQNFVELPAWITIFTSMFMHGGWMHLGGNMLYLWIFGNNVEDSMSRPRFMLFYILCGLAAALTQGIMDPSSVVPMVGASGAIGGVLGAYLMLHPRANVRVLIYVLVFVRVVHVPAVLLLGGWFAMQVFSGLNTPSEGGGVAFWAHVGGFVAGIVLVFFFKRQGTPMFTPSQTRSFTVTRPERQGSVPPVSRNPWA